MTARKFWHRRNTEATTAIRILFPFHFHSISIPFPFHFHSQKATSETLRLYLKILIKILDLTISASWSENNQERVCTPYLVQAHCHRSKEHDAHDDAIDAELGSR